MDKTAFPESFFWGVANSAFQVEGAADTNGKGQSIWDVFSADSSKIADGSNAKTATDFYHRYAEDIAWAARLGFTHFRCSIAWTRILPQGIGTANGEGLAHYHRVIDCCVAHGIKPWITLYHWDLPHALQLKGGWKNREIVEWFKAYAKICLDEYHHKVGHWMVLNEPTVFTGAGHLLGIHAPGESSIDGYLRAVHHANLTQAEVGRFIKHNYPDVQVGSTFSLTKINPINPWPWHKYKAEQIDYLLNYIHLYPLLGREYPYQKIWALKRIKKFIQPGDDAKMKFQFDFIGIQIYTRQKVKFSLLSPMLNAEIVEAKKRGVAHNALGWEVHPKIVSYWLKKLHKLGFSNIVITENGYADELSSTYGEKIEDYERIQYHAGHLEQLLSSIKKGYPAKGYFVWSLTDNFEWAEGLKPRFGLLGIYYNTLDRIPKASAWWWSKFLMKNFQF